MTDRLVFDNCNHETLRLGNTAKPIPAYGFLEYLVVNIYLGFHG